MTTYSIAEAQSSLSELIDRALRGEGVIVTRHGAPVAEIKAVRPVLTPTTRADIEWLEANRVTPKPGLESPSQSLAALRDEAEG